MLLTTRPFTTHEHLQSLQNNNTTKTDPRSSYDFDANIHVTHDIDLNHLGIDLDLDLASHQQDSDVDPSFSPFSTNSWLSSKYSPQSPALMNTTVDLMHPDNWLAHSAQLNNSRQNHSSARGVSHHRDSSLSSLGSAGPASPYSHSTTNPQIAVTDALGDGIHPMSTSSGDAYYQLAKSFAASNDGSNFYPNYPAYQPDYTMLTQQQHKPRVNRDLLPPPELSSGSASRSRPVSVASSVASYDSPATPAAGEGEDDRRTRNHGISAVPKLDRTMTDVYGDELFSPNFALNATSPAQPHQTQAPASPNNEMFAQRLQAAAQHLNATHSPVGGISHDRSPFRNGSPLAPSLHDFGSQRQQAQPRQARGMGFNTAQQMREQHKAEQDVDLQQHMQHVDAATPQTISPKDAMLDFHDDDTSNFPLFPQGPSAGMEGADALSNFTEQINKAVAAATVEGQGFTAMSMNAFPATTMPGIQIPQQYPFVPAPQMPLPERNVITPLRMAPSLRTPSTTPSRPSATSYRTSAHSSISPGLNSPRRPDGVSADGGTYTCTYHGCTLRFETPALLQKHKREGHRQAHGLGSAAARIRDVEAMQVDSATGLPASLLNTQAGPHKCERINPSTGKPCNTIFSRPYDLTRHEDTIHNGRKQKVRCNLCTEEKTFSRADALTRHYRVCHPDVEFPGKHRRRAAMHAHHHGHH